MSTVIPSMPSDPVTGGLDVEAYALQLGVTVEQALLRPEYQAALAARREQLERDTDESVAVKASQGDSQALEELRRRSS